MGKAVNPANGSFWASSAPMRIDPLYGFCIELLIGGKYVFQRPKLLCKQQKAFNSDMQSGTRMTHSDGFSHASPTNPTETPPTNNFTTQKAQHKTVYKTIQTHKYSTY
jgi:hypothetical protein